MVGTPRTEFEVGVPHQRLRGHVLSYAGFTEWADAPVRRRELPFGGVAVIIALDGTWGLGADAGADAPLQTFTSFAGGLIDRPVVSEHDGYAHSLQVDLTPLGAAAVLGVTGRALADRVVALDDLLGRAADLLAERLAHAPDWAARFALLDRWLARRVAAARVPSPDVAWSWGRLARSHGAVPIGTLVDELGCSRRHLATRFREEVGMTPKAYARLLRFERAAARIGAGADDLARIAADCGYYDQAHFNRDFREFAGTTPTGLAAERGTAGFLM